MPGVLATITLLQSGTFLHWTSLNTQTWQKQTEQTQTQTKHRTLHEVKH